MGHINNEVMNTYRVKNINTSGHNKFYIKNKLFLRYSTKLIMGQRKKYLWD